MLVHTWGMFSRYPRTGYPVAQWAELIDALAVIVTASLIAVIYMDRVGVARAVLALGFTSSFPAWQPRQTGREWPVGPQRQCPWSLASRLRYWWQPWRSGLIFGTHCQYLRPKRG